MAGKSPRARVLKPKKFPGNQLAESLGQEDLCHLRTLAEVEADYITKVLEAVGWRINGRNGAAELLGLHPSTLRLRMARLNVHRPLYSIR
jgi:transcriptional regulator with GAF, ATPase, and Fis domain